MSNVLQKQVSSAIIPGSGTIVTTAETQILYSGRCSITYQTIRMMIRAWLQITLTAGTTAVLLRLRRGNGLAGAIVSTNVALNVAASTTIECAIAFTEQILNGEFNDYSLTAQMTAAGANSTVTAGLIEVEAING